jgi:hypothetical protein
MHIPHNYVWETTAKGQSGWGYDEINALPSNPVQHFSDLDFRHDYWNQDRAKRNLRADATFDNGYFVEVLMKPSEERFSFFKCPAIEGCDDGLYFVRVGAIAAFDIGSGGRPEFESTRSHIHSEDVDGILQRTAAMKPYKRGQKGWLRKNTEMFFAGVGETAFKAFQEYNLGAIMRHEQEKSA